MTLNFRAGPTLFRYSAMLGALRQISKQKMTISSTKLKIRKTVGLKKKPHTHTHTLEGGFKKMRFRSADSLVSCGQKADSNKKRLRFQKYPDACGRA